MTRKKIIIVFSLMLLFILSFCCIGVGIYFNRITTPKYMMGEIIDSFGSKIDTFWNSSRSYLVGDTFSLDSSIKVHFDSEDLLKRSAVDAEAAKSYQFLKNVNQLQSQVVVMRDKKNSQAFLSLKQVLGAEEILNAKYVIDNSTKYYFVNQVLQTYVNDGSCNYFETLSTENTATDNIEYLYSFIKESLKENLDDEYFQTYQVKQNINGKERDVQQISLKLTDKVLKKILNGVLQDLKDDSRANQILIGIDEDFNKMKIRDKAVFLDSNESYTINIYTSTFLPKPLKYDIVYLKGEESSSLSFEGNDLNGDFYYLDNGLVKYHATSKYRNGLWEVEVFNSKEKKIGSLQYECSNNNLSIDCDFDDSKDKYNFIYSSKQADLKKGKSYSNTTTISLKHVQDKVEMFSGTISIDTKVSNQAKITEDVSNAVLSSTLTDEQRQKFQTLPETILERLER